MSGGQYIALSGLRERMDELDRLSSDIANIGTSGYKGDRGSTAAAERSPFDDALQTAIDTTSGGSRLDMRAGVIAGTGRSLDAAIDGPGFFVVQTASGPRYTRNGHFTENTSGQLTTEDGNLVQGADGQPITLGTGDVSIDPDGTVWSGDTQSGTLSVVTFGDPGSLVDDGTSLLSAPGQTAQAATTPVVRGASLEQSNVSVSDRIAELTNVSRGYEALEKALSLMMNDVDGQAITQLGKR